MYSFFHLLKMDAYLNIIDISIGQHKKIHSM